jgi:galactokinase
MTDGGFGGCTVSLVNDEQLESVCAALTQEYESGRVQLLQLGLDQIQMSSARKSNSSAFRIQFHRIADKQVDPRTEQTFGWR